MRHEDREPLLPMLRTQGLEWHLSPCQIGMADPHALGLEPYGLGGGFESQSRSHSKHKVRAEVSLGARGASRVVLFTKARNS